MKTIATGVGFLIAGLVVRVMLERFGIHIDFWVACILFAIGMALIVWGIIPSKKKDSLIEQVQVLVYPPLKKRKNIIEKLLRKK